MLVVKTESLYIPEKVTLTKEAVEIFNLFRSHAYIEEKSHGDITKCLCLKPFNEEDTLENILDEGMYEYYSTNPYAGKFIEILEELSLLARAMTFTEDDILATI